MTDDVYDFVCAGFGPAGLALAIALTSAPAPPPSSSPGSSSSAGAGAAPAGAKVFSSVGGLQGALRESAVRRAEGEASRRGGAGGRLEGRQLRVAFVEKQDTFRWHDAMQLPGSTMQIS